MKKTGKVVYLLTAVYLVTFVLVLGHAAAAPPKPIKLRLSCGLPITHFFTEAMQVFKREVETGTNGLVSVETYPGGELYKHMDVVRLLPMGGIEMGIVSSSHLVGVNLVGNIGGYYFMVQTDKQWFKARDTVMSIVDKLYNRSNIKIVVPLYYGEAAFGGNKLLRVPADAKGLKIRGPTKAHLECISAWGAVGSSLDAGEVYDALGKGAIDVVCTGWSSHGARAHYEVAKYFSGPTMFSTWFLMMNLDTWNGLPKDVQKIVAQAAEKTEKFTKDEVANDDKKWIAKIRESGASVHFFTPEELTAWAEATKPVYDKWVAESKKKGYGDEIIQVLRALSIKGY
jgi:TRAP-type C4-dicarboxylate transport system substrate-binding protein